MKRSVLSVLFLVVPALIGTGAFGVTAAAHAATAPQLQVSLRACGTGSSALWDNDGNPFLTVGTAPAGTCGAPAGSTYDPAYAQVVFTKAAGQPVPVSEPGFATDNYKSGSPRMVIELNNGKNIVGYPAASGLNGTDMAWAVGNSGTYTGYAAAYNAANASTTTIKEAFIVEDTDQPASATDTLTGIQFGGATVHPVYSDQVQIKNRATGKCLNEDKTNGALSTFTCRSSIYVSLRWQVATFADGSQYLQSVQTGGWVRDNGENNQLSLTSEPSAMRFGNGGFFRFPDNLVMGVNRQGNFIPVIGSPSYSSLNNVRWDFALAV